MRRAFWDSTDNSITFWSIDTEILAKVRLPPILTKLSDQSPNWVNPWGTSKGQLGQIWAHLGQKPDRGRSRKNRSILHCNMGPVT